MLRDILAVVEAPERAAPLVTAAIDLAQAQGAHLEIAVLTPGPLANPALAPLGAVYVPDEVLARDSQANVAAVERLAAGADRPVTVFGLHDDVAWLAGDLRQSRQIADLILIGAAKSWQLPWLRRRVIETLILASGTPLLIVPGGSSLARISHAVLGWKPGPEAIRAVHDLVHLAEPGARIDIVTIGATAASEAAASATEVQRHLERHGLVAQPYHIADREHREAGLLQRFAADGAAALLAVGGFGHSRLREVVLGGVTRDLIDECCVPVLLSH